MGRRQARERAFQAFFAADLGKIPHEQVLRQLLSTYPLSPEDADFAWELVRGTKAHLSEIDSWVRKLTRGWKFERLAAVDRNVLRLALYEIAFLPEIPPAVSINEAVELAKKYREEEAGAFVNGLLDYFWKEKANLRGACPGS